MFCQLDRGSIDPIHSPDAVKILNVPGIYYIRWDVFLSDLCAFFLPIETKGRVLA